MDGFAAARLELKRAGVDLGKTRPKTCPAPIVDHGIGRERAFKAGAKARAA
jgi:hypothetical protein